MWLSKTWGFWMLWKPSHGMAVVSDFVSSSSHVDIFHSPPPTSIYLPFTPNYFWRATRCPALPLHSRQVLVIQVRSHAHEFCFERLGLAGARPQELDFLCAKPDFVFGSVYLPPLVAIRLDANSVSSQKLCPTSIRLSLLASSSLTITISIQLETSLRTISPTDRLEAHARRSMSNRSSTR